MVWGRFDKTVISRSVIMGFKRVIYQMKGDIFLYDAG